MRPKMRMTQVDRTIELSPHMRRIVLTGADLQDFPENQESAHVKIILPKPGNKKPVLGMYPGAKKWMRSYTVRKFDAQRRELTIDFAVNDHQGLASTWAISANPGDYLGIAGPGPTKHTNYHADWHMIVGDLTALPAVAATAEKLSEEALGHIVIQVPTEADIQELNAPAGVKCHWIVNKDVTKNALLTHVVTLPEFAGKPAVFIACEAQHMNQLKAFIKTRPYYAKAQTYASGYWKA